MNTETIFKIENNDDIRKFINTNNKIVETCTTIIRLEKEVTKKILIDMELQDVISNDMRNKVSRAINRYNPFDDDTVFMFKSDDEDNDTGTFSYNASGLEIKHGGNYYEGYTGYDTVVIPYDLIFIYLNEGKLSLEHAITKQQQQKINNFVQIYREKESQEEEKFNKSRVEAFDKIAELMQKYKISKGEL